MILASLELSAWEEEEEEDQMFGDGVAGMAVQYTTAMLWQQGEMR